MALADSYTSPFGMFDHLREAWENDARLQHEWLCRTWPGQSRSLCR